MGFGKKLEEKMLAKGMKQADLVRATGISKTTLSSMISRDNTKVDVDAFIRICKVLGCKPEDFADEIMEAAGEQTRDEKQKAKTAEFIDLFSKLSTEQQELIIKQIKGILSK
ncbi:MAG: helix-turn-helix transcriptional regulator [Oscillospiraceae bacterium]|nr:helix-turn-helix transcriptional regulator [Oscillospiraceae bacterium]